MPWWTWLAFGVFGLALLSGALFAVNALRVLKRALALGDTLQARLDEVARGAEELERRMEHAADRAAELDRHRARLEASLERFSVLTWALSDARRDVDRLRAGFLRK